MTPEEWTAVRLSLLVATTATLASLPFGVAIAWLLARGRFWGKGLLDTLVHLPLILPPVVTGYLLLLGFGRRGPIGALLEETFGIVFAFRWTGAALACAVMGFPLMVRDVFQGSSGMLSTLVTSFLVGLTMSAFAVSRIRPSHRPGRFLMLLSFNNVLVFLLAHLWPDPNVFAGLMFAWGLTSGIAMSLTRGMIQIAAPHAYRARVMSMLQFSQMAGAPVGAILFGAVAQAIGILDTMLIIPASVVVIWIVFRSSTNLWNFEREDHHPHAT